MALQPMARAAYASIPGMGPTVAIGAQALDYGKKYYQAGLGGKARLATGLAGKALKFLGPVNFGISAIGAVGNLGSRLMKGENIVSAIGNTAYDTADYNALGLLKPTVNAIGGMMQKDTASQLSKAQEDLAKAQASGDLGGAYSAAQTITEAMETAPNAMNNAGLYGAADPNFQARLSQAQAVTNAQMEQMRQVGDMQFDQARRQMLFNSNLTNQNAEKAMGRSYVADTWKSNQAMMRDNLNNLGQLANTGMQGISQAALMRY